jgi:DHA3 family macrolide efflux protein-like MFS transporter
MKDFKKNFFTLYIGQAISQFTSSILQMAIVWYLILQKESAIVIALSGIMSFLPQGIIGIFVGVYIDRYDRKKILIFSDLAIALFSFLLVIQGRNISRELILFVLAMRSIGTAFHQPALGAIVPQIVPKEQLIKYTGYIHSLQSISLLLSPGVAAFLFTILELPFIVFFDCIGAIIALICIKLTNIPKTTIKNSKSSKFIEEFLYGIRIVRRKKLLSFIFIGALFSYIYTPIFVLYPMVSLNFFKKTQWHAGIVEILFAIGMMIGGFILSKIEIIKNKFFCIGLSALGISISILLSGLLSKDQFLYFIVLSTLLGFFSPFYQGLQMIIFQEKIKNRYLGRVLSLFTAITVFGTPIGLVISGIVTELIGIKEYFFISGVLLFIISSLYFFKRIEKRRD